MQTENRKGLMMKTLRILLAWLLLVSTLQATEYHVSTSGDDGNAGSQARPFKTISRAAELALPGDVITVHEGVYRERINPPRGGTSDDKRITYQAAPGEKAVIKGSEVVKNWKKVENDTWQTVIPDSFFDKFNPFSDKLWGDWCNTEDRELHTGAVYHKNVWLKEAVNKDDVLKPAGDKPVWFAEVTNKETKIWAQFKDLDPNKEGVEINVRQTVFYSEKPGINYITLRGFTLEHAATPWSPPTAEQIGLIGTHWSKGWIIENNTIRYSFCTGITLGKHGDEYNNWATLKKAPPNPQEPGGFFGTIHRSFKNGWNKDNIGQHIVRNNHIAHCGQAGIVGAFGCAFSTITRNEIHDIHLDRPFDGCEQAGIKFHAPVDTVISHNHVYRCGGHGGIWLDWMTQGARVTGNLLHDNEQDLFVEVNHGPFLVDHNIFLSEIALLEASGGGAYAHNLFSGAVRVRKEPRRKTPFFKQHSTEIVGKSLVLGSDERFHNNLFTGPHGLRNYDHWALEYLQAVDNVYLACPKPTSKKDSKALVAATFKPNIRLQEEPDGWWLEMAVDPAWVSGHRRALVTTESLGKAKLPNAPYENPDGTPYRLNTDYSGKERSTENPAPGPFRAQKNKSISLKVWPKD